MARTGWQLPLKERDGWPIGRAVVGAGALGGMHQGSSLADRSPGGPLCALRRHLHERRLQGLRKLNSNHEAGGRVVTGYVTFGETLLSPHSVPCHRKSTLHRVTVGAAAS